MEEIDRFLKYYVSSAKDAYYSMSEGLVVVFVPPENSFYTLNQEGSRIWELADGTHTLKEISIIISSEFGMKREIVVGDVFSFIRSLSAKGILFFKRKRRKM